MGKEDWGDGMRGIKLKSIEINEISIYGRDFSF